MAYVTGEVIPDPDGARHFWVIFKHREEVIAQWPVASPEQGQQDIVEALRGLGEQKGKDW